MGYSIWGSASSQLSTLHHLIASLKTEEKSIASQHGLEGRLANACCTDTSFEI